MEDIYYWRNAFDSEPDQRLKAIKQNDMLWEKYFEEQRSGAIKHGLLKLDDVSNIINEDNGKYSHKTGL